ncbi:MAG: GHKL domain-containing protein [Candidatus Latescibacteria bacterium]|nr:GHKL domain-containing protein [Candidatus Latescibacterota bacterium]NIM65813.1 GHKL domain-containing protein [Candidatus Latescibacterota bacterium]NIO02305.1 GHKL domain-containing protein [Candidatus Latescibacterota bacterium]NIO29176.1 GHKL domain-containing protein [Candidatus Latescibacterota bacterium]NIO56791.1 GHKL domain-containing protein [Candidatus Latescibacterota bacterium]
MNCGVRVALIVITALIIAYMIHAGKYVTTAVFSAFLLVQAFALVRFVESSSRMIGQFIQSIEFSDLSIRFRRGPTGRIFDELRNALDAAVSRFRRASIEREELASHLRGIIQQVGVGLIVYDGHGKVTLFNTVGKQLLGIGSLTRIAEIDQIHPELGNRMRSLKPGDRSLATVYIGDRAQHVALKASEFRRGTEALTLVSLHNISPELNEKELEAWHNLIRVLTHEVKNSLTPIQSLSKSIEDILFKDGAEPLSSPEVAEALRIIQKRSEGLQQFVDAYRSLTHLPRPNYQQCVVSELFRRVKTLVAPQIDAAGIKFSMNVDPPDMAITADAQMIEQALINLTVNAIEAVTETEQPEIHLAAEVDGKARVILRVIDNGRGIMGGSLEKIFIPFYSTKKSGSGIGLSLSRQIARLHGGDLTAQSAANDVTVFTITL